MGRVCAIEIIRGCILLRCVDSCSFLVSSLGVNTLIVFFSGNMSLICYKIAMIMGRWVL